MKTTEWRNSVGSGASRWVTLGVALLLVACDERSTSGPSPDAADTSSDVSPDLAEEARPDTAEEVSTDIAEEVSPEVTPEVTAPLCGYTEPPCSDEQIAALSFSKTRDGGAIVEEGAAVGEFLSHIDATAGGFQGTRGYTYARFTEAGLVKVDISDEESLESMDWDIAFRRYIARLNSGVSGPSCVLGGRTAPATTFETLSAVPSNLVFRAEQYFTADGCEYVPETSGIGSPLTILSSYWNYTGCVTMSGNVYVVKLRDGRHVKLQFQSYYSPSVQATCEATGSAPSPNGAGNIRLRWAFID
jgi:hypothetical protein